MNSSKLNYLTKFRVSFFQRLLERATANNGVILIIKLSHDAALTYEQLQTMWLSEFFLIEENF